MAQPSEVAELQTPLLQAPHNEAAEGEQPHVIIEPSDNPANQAHKTALGSTHWILTTCILLGDMFGLGTLSLPADFARLGWVPALSLLVAFSFADLYSGSLYTRLCIHLPSAIVFDHIGEAALGKVGRYLVYGTCYLTILFEPVIFHLTSVESLMQVFHHFGITRWTASLIITVMILPMSQVQHMHEVGWIAIAGTVGMLLATFIVVAKLVLAFIYAPATAAPANTALFAPTTATSKLVGVMDLVFAFGGQVNWMRYITTMRSRSKFLSAVSVTTGAMSVLYVLVGVVGYATRGDDIDLHRPITSVLPHDMWTVVMNAGLFLHCIIAYQINVNVWSHSFLHVLLPHQAREASAAHPIGRYALWGAVTLVCVLFSLGTSYIFPFFSDVMAIIAALGDLASMLGLPCLFALKLLKLRRPERLICWVLVAVSGVMSAAGVFSSVQQLVVAYQEERKHGGGGGNGLLDAGLGLLGNLWHPRV